MICFIPWSIFFGGPKLAELKSHLLRLGRNYRALNLLGRASGTWTWNMVPKVHYVVAHLGTQSELLNPRFAQTCKSESLVGKCCKVYKTSQNGPLAAGVHLEELRGVEALPLVRQPVPAQLVRVVASAASASANLRFMPTALDPVGARETCRNT